MMYTIDHIRARSRAIVEYWFGTLDDDARLDSSAEPFQTCYVRWYGKQASVDAEIRRLFESDLLEVTNGGTRLWSILDAWASVPDGLLALTILLDQLPRNMYRGTARMYDHDPLALVVASRALADEQHRAQPLVRQLFLNVPFMHIENLTLQRFMVGQFQELASVAEVRSPHNLPFFRFALRYAERHLEVIEKYRRFPHRNVILGRTSTADELEYLQGEDPGF